MEQSSVPQQSKQRLPAKKRKGIVVDETSTSVLPAESASIEPFRFTDLPREIQLRIFQFLIHRSPEQTATEKAILAGAIASMLLLNKTFFHLFGPEHYQAITITFGDPVAFANTFLSRCTDLCLFNLRHLECIIDDPFPMTEDGFVCGSGQMGPPILTTKKLQEVLCTCRELRNLQDFRLTYVLGSSSLFGHHQHTRLTDQAAIWTQIDGTRRNVFSKLEKRVLARTFKGFSPSRGIVIHPERTSGGFTYVKEISLTFRKE